MTGYQDYDKTDPFSIEKYSKGLIGKTFRQIAEEDDARTKSQGHMLQEGRASYGVSVVKEKKRNKGNLGQLIEEKFFHYKCNSDERPDFHEAGVELKVTPYKKNKDGSVSAKERLILTMIDYNKVVNETFYESHLWNKAKLILLVYYLYVDTIKQNIDYRIDYTQLFTPPKEDLKIIEEDFNKIVKKVRDGKAHELSESDTEYLTAAPKASSSRDRRTQPFSKELAKPRAFAFKSSYMTYVLRTFLVPGKKTYERIGIGNKGETFEEYVTRKINAFKGHSVTSLAKRFDIDITTKPKNLEAMIAYRILGIKGNNAEEFEKAGIVVKTIRIQETGKIKESMSFPTFKFNELAHETWEDSTFGNYLRETRFLFVVYKYDSSGELILKGSQFWNMPYKDLEEHVKNVWEKTVNLLYGGLVITEVHGRHENNFPKASEDSVCHVRPHGRNAKDVDVLPDGRECTKQCFWLNNTYILSQLDDDLKD